MSDDAASTGPAPRGGGTIPGLLGLVRISHTLFALPWAFAGMILAAGGLPGGQTLLWVLGAMVGARTAAMAFNRLVDRSFDATNARTAARPSVTGDVGPAAMAILVVLAAGLFVLAAFQLNALCGWLSLPTLVLLLGYSYCKRFTSHTHFVLGLALGLSPVGAWLAVRGTFDGESLAAWALGAAVLAWTAGFDMLYACQDLEHDRREGLRSIPARLGIGGALRLARWCHAAVPLALTAACLLGPLGPVFLAAVAVVALLLIYEHRLVRPDDLSRVGRAFFNVNVAISFVVLAGVWLDVSLGAGA